MSANQKNSKKVKTLQKAPVIKNHTDEPEDVDQELENENVDQEQPVEQKKTGETKSQGKKRFEGVDKGDAPNNATAYINCSLNVNNAKKCIKRFIETILGLEGFKTMNAQYPYTAIVELFTLHLVRSSAQYNRKNNTRADLYGITLETIQKGVEDSKDFSEYIKSLSAKFDPTGMDYMIGFFDSDKKLREFIEKRAFENRTNYSISNDALNLICYLCNHQMAQLTKTACELSAYARKQSVGIRNYTHACNIHFSGELLALVQQRLSEIENLFTNKKESANSDEAVKENKEDDDAIEEEEEPAEDEEPAEEEEEEQAEEEEEEPAEDEEEMKPTRVKSKHTPSHKVKQN